MASVIIISGMLHVIWVLLVEYCTAFSLSYDDLLTLLAAQSGNRFQQAVERAVRHPHATVAYFATIYAFSSFFGYSLRWLVRKFRWDRKGWIGPLLKFDTPWYYLFRDLEPGVSGTWVNAVVDVGNKSFLFSGIVDDFHVDKEGGLDRIILIEASQQLLPAGAEEQGHEEEPQSVEGKLVLRYSTIKTMTVDKFTVVAEEL